jgi:dTDP-glucose 4,6-dehydratase/UDP-glucose 4-epimerase
MNYSGKNALITGGLGFIGSSLARRLLGLGANVAVLDNLEPKCGGNIHNVADIASRLQIKIGDVREQAGLDALIEGQDYIFNLAAQTGHVDSMREPHVDLAINADAQLAIVESCRRVNPGLKIVYASTRQLYGRPQYLPVDEAHPIKPVDVNGISKLAGEQFHILYHEIYGIRSCVLRLTNTYGPGMRVKDARQTFLGIWVRRLLENEAIQVFGDGTQLRDFNYVDDCVEALLLAGSSASTDGKVFNVGSEEVISLGDLARMMLNLGYGGRMEIVPFPSDRKAIDIGNYYADFSLFRRECGWMPSVGLAAGLRRTVDYYRQHLEQYL